MLILELYEGDKLYGIIGLDDGNKAFVKGLDDDYYLNWFDGGIDNEDGDVVTPEDGIDFLKAVRDKLMKGVYFDEMNVKGPVDVKVLPEVVDLGEGTKEVLDEEYD